MKLITKYLCVTLSALLISGPLSAQTDPGLQIKVVDETTLTVQVTDATGAPAPDAAVVFRMPDSGPTGAFADGTHAAVAYTDQTGQTTPGTIRWSAEPGSVTLRITATRGTTHGGILMEHEIGGPATAITQAQSPVPQQPKAETAPALPSPGVVSEPTAPAPEKPQSPVQPGTPDTKQLPRPQVGSEPATPRVSVTRAPSNEKVHSGSNKKWLILALVAAGAGAGVAMAGKGKSSSSSSSGSTGGITIGTPTVTVGH